MSQVIADPKEQFRFAAYLREVSDFLRRRRNQFQEALNEASIVCQDRKYERFQKSVECALESCEHFETLTVHYASQLDQKARLGDRYLDAGNASGSSTLANSGITATAESIGGFEVSLTRFSEATLPEAQTVLNTVQNRIFQLEQRSFELRNTISSLKMELASQFHNDESVDNSYAIEFALREVASRLDWVETARRRLEDASSSFRHAQTKMDELLGQGTKQALHFLRDAMDNLSAYRSVQPGDIASTDDNQSPTQSEGGCSLSLSSSSGFDRVPLPEGFVWVPITDIDVDRELVQVQGPADFKKVPYEAVRNTLERFREKIVPELSKGTSRDALTKADAESRVFDTSGLGGAYDVFLGNDPIHLTFNKEGQYGITNGRHRIRAAIDAGWTHIPATIGEQR